MIKETSKLNDAKEIERINEENLKPPGNAVGCKETEGK